MIGIYVATTVCSNNRGGGVGATSDAKGGVSDGPANFDDSILEKKINGTLEEYIINKDLAEVKTCLGEWGRVVSVYHMFVLTMLRKSVEAKETERAGLVDLAGKIVGVADGVPATLYTTAVSAFLEELPDLMCDAPKAHEYAGRFIAAGLVADDKCSAILKALTEAPMQEVMYGDLPLKVGLQAFNAIKASEGEAKMLTVYDACGCTLVSMLPEDRRSDGTLEDQCDRVGLKVNHSDDVIYPILRGEWI